MAKGKYSPIRERVFGSQSSHGNISHAGGALDARSDVQQSFVNELGFKEVRGTNSIPTATLNSYAIALKGLERKYGAISASENPIFVTGARGNTFAAVVHNPDNPANQFMVINSKVLGSTKVNLKSQASSERDGWSARTNGKITKRNAYTVTHEYGHMVHNVLVSQSGKSHETISKEVAFIAKSKYNAKGSVSRYGSRNANEFFAEAFASYNSGSPNAYGKAIGDYLKRNPIKR